MTAVIERFMEEYSSPQGQEEGKMISEIEILTALSKKAAKFITVGMNAEEIEKKISKDFVKRYPQKTDEDFIEFCQEEL